MEAQRNLQVKRSDVDLNSKLDEEKKKKKKKKKKKSRKSMIVSCFRSSDYGCPTVDQVDGDGNIDIESVEKNHSPTHLVVMINGLIGSAQDWRFAAKQLLKKYPQDLIVHCSERNSSWLTFDGVDVMGNRLADEVNLVIKRHPNLEKISFIGHSLGGLVARYAIAKLYTKQGCQENGYCRFDVSNGKIGGLEPINFITVATPHLGTRGHRQVPMFCGLNMMEKVAPRISWLLGRTGRQLFLKDKGHGQPPLLLQMVKDCEGLKYLSALQSFKRHVVYANAHFDYIVGWGTSSIRRRSELPKRKNLARSGRYPHILKGDATSTTKHEGPMDSQANSHETTSSTMEEEMIRGLNKINWERVDVSFKGSKQRYFAHNAIQVNSPWINSDGADIIQHIVDNFCL